MSEGMFVAAAIPVFFALICIEYVVAQRQGRDVYRFNDAITCLSLGITHLVVKGLYVGALVAAYAWTYDTLALFELSSGNVLVWLFGVLAVDHSYYWWHRVTHRSKLFWATHVQHHQSEDYNLAVALRQTWTSALSSLPFYLPLAVLGVPPLVFGVASVTNTLYQFWIHTETIRDLGPLEAVLNTPAHHRVHHAVDPAYIDKNYAGFLIVFDRLYGTFAQETKPATYGTVKPLRSFDPIWANVGPFLELYRETIALKTWPERVYNVFAAPEWRPNGDLRIPEPSPGRVTWDPTSTPAVHAYIGVQFAVIALLTTWVLVAAEGWSWPWRLASAGFIVWTTHTWALLFERRDHATWMELLRLAVVAVVGAFTSPLLVAYAVLSAGGFALASSTTFASTPVRTS
jgi:sterol desaturase/sphingolipid hydroxylase (fatty acid hydroxylase superfamily)